MSQETPLFFNELGVRSIDVGTAAFDCMGAMPPHDHPHVYLNMGAELDILCPYCSREYRLDSASCEHFDGAEGRAPPLMRKRA
jgi:uncharacterized Zn-finger protein